MFGQGFNSGFFGDPPCFTDTTDIFKDNSGVALYTLDYDASSSKDITTNTLQILGDTSCIATYRLNGGSADLSGNYNGTDTNITYTDGYFGQCASFNGSSSFITLPGNMLNSLTAISASAWVYRRTGSSDNYEYILSGGIAVSGQRYGIAVNDAGSGSTDNKFYITDGASSFHTNTVCNYNTWYHVVYTWSGTELKFYVNGSLDSTFTAVNCNFQSSGNGHKIGEYHHNGSYEWEGEIDQVRFFNKAISASEVTTLYNEIGENNGTSSNVDFGVGGKSLYGTRFNGSSSYISANNPNSGGGARSFSAWIKTTSTGFQSIITNGGASHASGLNMFVYNNKLYSTSGKGNGENYGPTSSADVNTGDWVHCALTMSGTAIGSTLKTYVNGTLDGTHTTTILITDTYDAFRIGGRYINGSYAAAWFNGSIDQVRIFNKEISASEVSKLYGNGAGEIACEHTATTTDVNYPITNLAYYKLDNNSKDSGKSRGKFNQGVTFIGNSAGIVNTTLQLSSTAHSVSLWMKPQDLTATKWQIMFFSAFNGHPSFTLGKRPDRTTSFHYRNESSNEVYFTLSNANTWYHVVVTRNNSGSTVYVNGSSVATDSNSMGSYGSSSYQKASIGSNPNYPAEYFDGTLDQIRVYNVALTATDVANLYNNETTTTAGTLAFPTGKTAIATYKLDGNGVDISGNYSGSEGANIVYGYNGSDTNVEYTFGKYGQAAVFNGSSSYIDLPRELADVWRAAGAFSTSLWFKRNGNQTDTTYGGRILHILDDIYIRIDIQTNNTIKALVVTSAPAYPETVSNIIPDGVWQHIVFTGDSNGIKLYLNGALVDSDSWNGTFMTYTNTNYKFNRLGYSGSGISYLEGEIDQVRFFTSALSAENVKKLYNEKPETDTSNFKAVLYEGNGAARYISNVGMDLETNNGLVWLKGRDSSRDHRLFDSVRGATKGLYADLNHAEFTESGLDSFEKNGFFLGSVAGNNANNESFVAWNWKGGSLLNRSASFNGSSSRITLPKLSTITADVTVSGWLNLGNTTTSNRIRFLEINLDGNGYAGTLMVLYKPSNGQWVARAGNGTSSNSDVLTHTYTLTQSTWYHVCFTRDDSTNVTKFYINGSLQDTETVSVSSSYPSNATGVIGDLNYSAGLNYNWLGTIDQVRIFNKSLSSSEVTQLYNETVSTINTLQVLGDTSCVAAYPLGAGAGDLSNTYSGTPSNVTFNNPGHLTRNTSGTIESTVSANQDAGFSIVKYTSTGTSGSTVGHGLSSAPEIAIFKCISTTGNWITSITNIVSNKYLYLNNTGTGGTGGFSIDGTNITLNNTYGDANTSGRTYVAYCWHSVTGYSKIGSFNGDGSSDRLIDVGFKPSWVMLKNTETNGYRWYMLDSARDPANPAYKRLFANDATGEHTNSSILNFEDTGFRLITSDAEVNQSGTKILYMAFK